MYSLGAKLSVVCAGPRQPPNCWCRCHLPVVVGVLLETNLGIFTEGNLLLSTSQPSTLGNQQGARSHQQASEESKPDHKHPSRLQQHPTQHPQRREECPTPLQQTPRPQHAR